MIAGLFLVLCQAKPVISWPQSSIFKKFISRFTFTYHYCIFFTVTVEFPKVTTHPVSQKDVLRGKPVAFHVRATGTQPLSYQWEWKSVESESDQWQWCETDWSMLTISSVQKVHEGSYRCVVSNYAGSVTSKSAELTVGKNN